MFKMISTSLLLFSFSLSAAPVVNVDFKGSCKDLQIGQQKLVSISGLLSKTNIPQHYTLIRKSNDRHALYVNYNFSFDSDYRKYAAVSKKQLDSDYKDKIQSCFDHYEHKLVDETGRGLKLIVYRSEKHAEVIAPDPITISVFFAENGDTRAFSRKYPHNIDCRAVVHEAFHFTGLVDEYEETHLKTLIFKKPKYNRRALGPESSAMRSLGALDNYSSVLFSGHVNAILYPNCEMKNAKYNACSNFAYKTGTKKIAEICENEDWVKAD